MPRIDPRIQHLRGFALRASLLALSAAASVASFAAEPAASSLVMPAAPASPNTSERARAYFGDHVLTDQDGKTHRFYSDLLQGRVVLINVIFTHCPSACPMMTERLKLVRKQVGDGFGRDVYFLSLSVDPARDTPEALKRFAERHNVDSPGWRFLVSDAQTLKTLLSRLGQWTDSPDDHTTLLIAGNASKSHWTKLRPDAPPEQIAAELARLK
jgi:protein SCO1